MVIAFILRKCESILAQHKDLSSFTHPLAGILRELKVVVSQAKRLGHRKQEFLDQVESFRTVERDKQLNIRRDPQESFDIRQERDGKDHRFTGTLINLESHRRQIISTIESEERILERQLTILLNQYEVLTMYDETE